MRNRVTERLDYLGLLGVMGDRGDRALAAIDELETALDEGQVGYVSVVANA